MLLDTAFAADEVSFAREIRPILNQHCVGCHGGVKRAADISFIVRERVVALDPADNKKPIRPGDPAGSELIRRVTSAVPSERMPPPEHGPALSGGDIEKLRRWIEQGAQWEDHWAFAAPSLPPVPQVNGSWPRSDLDKFVLVRIVAAGLEPSPPASASAWLRRVSFDLIGLPPTLEELNEFEADPSLAAREAVVDRLLASPRFGERWASVWLDLARYADSMGFEKDPHRPIWPWRDWVIRALNQNMPFDEFSIRQLAGDLLPGATLEDALATAFHRNTQANTEGGTDDEEYRIAAVLDRVNTTFEVWQGITFRCAQCHAHPYEPIEHAEYYQVMAFFNNTRDWDLSPEFPLLSVPVNEADNASAQEMDRRTSVLRRADFFAGAQVASNASQWLPLLPAKAESTHGTRLMITPDGEVRTQGTVAHSSRFTVEVPVSPQSAPIAAIRLEALPFDPAKALLSPEGGFVVSRFRAALPGSLNTNKIASAENKDDPPLEGEITFCCAFGDEAEPFRDTDSAIRPDREGWGAWPRMNRPRSIVFVPDSPIQVPAEGVLRFVIYHDEGAGDAAALVMNRFRLSYSSDGEWSSLLADVEFQKRRAELKELASRRGAIKSTSVPVLRENEATQARPTAVFVRGNWMDKGEEVRPGVPQVYHVAAAQAPADRLGFARWLFAENNPLTARIVVNRYWEQLFGKGLVETLEDFGSSGLPPSNPELLDHLAVRFQREMKWDTRRLLRELVLSAVYGQQAHSSPELMERDPRNLLLARGPRTRLSAEMVRDQALAVSGLLSVKMYGPPVMPPQPDGIWRAAYSGEKWTTSEGEDRYRRAIYTYIRRTAGYPSYQTFDAPSRDICTARRLRTNTPLQALVTLNDPVYVEAAVALARRMKDGGGPELENQIRHGCLLTTSQQPAAADLHDLVELHGLALASYRTHPESAARLADSAELAALVVVASTILNLDSALTR